MQENISEKRLGSCALGGALSVSSFIPHTVTVIHAPQGCAHQMFSMLHAMMNDEGICVVSDIVVSNLTDRDVIFGGEETLREALDRAAAKNPELIVLVTSCVPETIGDECAKVCAAHPAADKITYVPTSGFLGGSSMDGENTTLKRIAERVSPSDEIAGTVALIGEKNLETEVEENFAEVKRLLSLLHLEVTVRFCRNEPLANLKKLSSASCLIARDERVLPAAEHIAEKINRPLVREFPRGLCGSIRFLEDVSRACKITEELISDAVSEETAYQKKVLEPFSTLAGHSVNLGIEPFAGTFSVAREAMERIGILESPEGIEVKLPFYLPVGTAGTVKMLNLWKRKVLYG